MTSEQKQELRDAAGEIERAAHERSLEVALAAVAAVFERLDGQELRDALAHLVAGLDQEVRQQAVVTLAILQSIGISEGDPMLTPLRDRAFR